MELKENGLYILKDIYFSDFRSKYLPQNKHECRPYFYAIKERDDLFWMIPLSSQVNNYKSKIEKYESHSKNKECIFYHIGKIMGKKSVFLIGNTIPVSPKYIKHAYTICNIPYVINTQNLLKAIKKKHKKYLSLVKQGKLHPKVDIMSIRDKLLK